MPARVATPSERAPVASTAASWVWVPATLLAVTIAAWLTRHAPAHIPDSEFYRAAARAARDGRPGWTDLTSYFSGFTPVQILRHDGRTKFIEFPVGYPAYLGALSVPFGFEGAWRVGQLLAAGAIGWSTTVVVGARGGLRRRIVASCALTTVTLLSPAVTTSLLRVQTEFLLCALCALVLAGVLLHVRDGRAITLGAVAAALAPLVRFVGVGLIALPLLATRSLRPRSRVLLGLAMVTPAVLNQLWIVSSGSTRGQNVQLLGTEYLTTAALTAEGWFWKSGAADPRLSLDTTAWSWIALIAAVALVAVGASALRTASFRAQGAWVPLAGAGALLVVLLGGMIVADRYVRPDTRQLLPVQLCVLWFFAMVVVIGWDAWTSATRWVVVAGVAVWMIAAIAPWSTLTMQIHEPALAHRAEIAAAARATGAKLIFSDDAGAVYTASGIRSAYLPFDPNIITEQSVDETELTQQLVCNLSDHSAAVVLIPRVTLHNWGKVTAVLDHAVELGQLARSNTRHTVSYVSTEQSCPSGRAPATVP